MSSAGLSSHEPTSHKRHTTATVAFHGLPPEILHHIGTLLPFHDLVKVYTSLPRLHRPNFQQLLDHSLALMLLTLEIRQDLPELMDLMTLFTSAAVMHSEWRVTDFDMERMTVEFELEEKLGLRMAQKRAREDRRHSSPSLSLGLSLTSTVMAAN
jgi:hypothetical protein